MKPIGFVGRLIMRATTTLLLAMVCGFLATSAAEAALIRFYEFDQDGVLPSAAADTEYFGAAFPGPAPIETDVFNVASGTLEQRTIGFNGAKEYILGNAVGGDIFNGGLDSSLPIHLEARVRVNASTGNFAVTMDVLDGQFRYAVSVVPTGVLINFNPLAPIVIPGFDMTQFHTYGITSPGSSSLMTVSVDGVQVFSGQGVATISNGMQWGDISSVFSTGEGASADWDFVRLSNVPEPGTGILLLSGLVSLALWRRRGSRHAGRDRTS